MVQALDGREDGSTRILPTLETEGLYQAITYHAGVQGGGWLVSSLAGNNFPTVHALRHKYWDSEFRHNILRPHNPFAELGLRSLINMDLLFKAIEGFHVTVVDAWGRLVSGHLLRDSRRRTLSSVARLKNFVRHEGPLPIITALGVRKPTDLCRPRPWSATYEFTPFEFGSWDPEISAFTPTKYFGSRLSNGEAVVQNKCVTNHDNLGYIMGVTSNMFNEFDCPDAIFPSLRWEFTRDLLTMIPMRNPSIPGRDFYGTLNNPFYHYNSISGATNSPRQTFEDEHLHLVDGSQNWQSSPIMPLLQPERNVSVIIVNDNAPDIESLYPNGTGIHATSVVSEYKGLDRMPYIPPPPEFMAREFNKRATFFGCYEPNKTTIIYLPNSPYYQTTPDTFPPSSKSVFKQHDMFEAVYRGIHIATQDYRRGWGKCLGCAIFNKHTDVLPAHCKTCFDEYCYRHDIEVEGIPAGGTVQGFPVRTPT